MWHPFGTSRAVWDMLQCLSIGYDFVMIPFMAAFGAESSKTLDAIGVLISCFWSMDMVLSFFTGFQQGGIIEMRPAWISKHYVQTWFLPDIFILFWDLVYVIILLREASADAGKEEWTGILRKAILMAQRIDMRHIPPSPPPPPPM